jgi:hypothetical protein
MNFQMKATETEDRMVGKKNSARSSTLPREFFTRKTASSRAKIVWNTTTTSMNLTLFSRAFMNRSSPVRIRRKFSVPTFSNVALKPSQSVIAYCTACTVGIAKKIT